MIPEPVKVTVDVAGGLPFIASSRLPPMPTSSGGVAAPSHADWPPTTRPLPISDGSPNVAPPSVDPRTKTRFVVPPAPQFQQLAMTTTRLASAGSAKTCATSPPLATAAPGNGMNAIRSQAAPPRGTRQ